MNRLDRLTALLLNLQTRRVVRAQDLAERFGVSLRTVYRDIRSLEAAGVPIGAEAGVGYFLEDYHLPPVHFTNAEASALLFAAKLLEQSADASLREPFQSAFDKIRSVLKRSEQEYLSDLEPQIIVSPRARPEPVSEVLHRVQAALVRGHVLTFAYRSPYADAPTHRAVEPIGLLHYGSGWHLIGYCRMRQAYRDFRTDRIAELRETPERFARRDRLTLARYLDAVREAQHLEAITVGFERETARFAQEERCAFGFVGEEIDGERVRMHFLTQFTEGLGRWLLMFGNGVTIESPDSFREQVRGYAREVRDHYL
jgi:predicted DNA-binding transcriptional regulator YafY